MNARFELTDVQWHQLEPLLPTGFKRKNKRRPGRPWNDHRQVLNGILWVLRTGAPWRDLPERYGAWQTCYDRFVRWQKDGTWQRLLARQQTLGAVEWQDCAIDATLIKAHPCAAGAKRGSRNPRILNRRKRLDAVAAA